ncbi:recombinase family protein [Ideonella sp. 4Y16]|uniref:recombinase family protein n=1 Tax=Ideonella alba TaxID=2824118 RepID=UPI001B3723BB|nr:recombinase family protein [Ideonella alba]MBQ0942286.1 recombinase family protein [Ideonella alba]
MTDSDAGHQEVRQHRSNHFISKGDFFMLVAFYVRVSTGRQAEEGVSLDGQVDQMQAWAASGGHQVVETYIDAGLTATDDRRPEFRRMIADATSAAHPFEAIVVFSQSRFYRDAIAFGMYERQLRRHNVKLISITQPTADDEAGQMVRQILSSFDEYTSRENGKNVRRSMVENARQGFFNGSKPPFGYMAVETDVKGRNGLKRKLEPHKEEAEVVRNIFKWSIAGDTGVPWGIKKIASHLNDTGVTHRGKSWRKNMIAQIVNSTTYCGDYVFNRRDSRTGEFREDDEWVITKVPAIVTKEDVEKAAALRADRAPNKGSTEFRKAASKTLLTGLAKCAHCGAGLVLVSGKGGAYDYYRCGTRVYKGSDLCDMPNVPREELDAVVLQVVADQVLQPERIEGMLEQLRTDIAAMQAPDREREKLLQRQLARATEQINTWYELVESGKLEMLDSLRDRLTSAQKQMAHMSAELAEIGKRRQVPLKKFGKSQIDGFAGTIRSEIMVPGSKYAKPYLSALVSEIRISPAGATAKGSHADMAVAVSGWRPGTPGLVVPRHGSNWRGWQDSNPRPLGS